MRHILRHKFRHKSGRSPGNRLGYKCVRLLVIAAFPLGFITACSSSGGAQPILGSPDDTAGSTGGVTNPNIDGGTSGSDGSGVSDAGSTDGGSNIGNAAPIGILQGNWSTGCLSEEGLNLYTRQTVAFSGENMNYELAYFSDADCTAEETVVFNLNGHSFQRTGITVPANQSVETTLGTALAVNFHLSEATVDNQPVPSENQDQRGYKAEVAYQIVLVDSNTLYFGDNELAGYEGTSNDNRPISLDFNFSYNKQ